MYNMNETDGKCALKVDFCMAMRTSIILRVILSFIHSVILFPVIYCIFYCTHIMSFNDIYSLTGTLQ